MNAKSSPIVPPGNLGDESAAADAEYGDIPDDVEVQEANLAPVEKPSGEFDPQQQPAPTGPIKLVAAANESTAKPKAEEGQR